MKVDKGQNVKKIDLSIKANNNNSSEVNNRNKKHKLEEISNEIVMKQDFSSQYKRRRNSRFSKKSSSYEMKSWNTNSWTKLSKISKRSTSFTMFELDRSRMKSARGFSACFLEAFGVGIESNSLFHYVGKVPKTHPINSEEHATHVPVNKFKGDSDSTSTIHYTNNATLEKSAVPNFITDGLPSNESNNVRRFDIVSAIVFKSTSVQATCQNSNNETKLKIERCNAKTINENEAKMKLKGAEVQIRNKHKNKKDPTPQLKMKPKVKDSTSIFSRHFHAFKIKRRRKRRSSWIIGETRIFTEKPIDPKNAIVQKDNIIHRSNKYTLKVYKNTNNVIDKLNTNNGKVNYKKTKPKVEAAKVNHNYKGKCDTEKKAIVKENLEETILSTDKGETNKQKRKFLFFKRKPNKDNAESKIKENDPRNRSRKEPESYVETIVKPLKPESYCTHSKVHHTKTCVLKDTSDKHNCSLIKCYNSKDGGVQLALEPTKIIKKNISISNKSQINKEALQNSPSDSLSIVEKPFEQQVQIYIYENDFVNSSFLKSDTSDFTKFYIPRRYITDSQSAHKLSFHNDPNCDNEEVFNVTEYENYYVNDRNIKIFTLEKDTSVMEKTVDLANVVNITKTETKLDKVTKDTNKTAEQPITEDITECIEKYVREYYPDTLEINREAGEHSNDQSKVIEHFFHKTDIRSSLTCLNKLHQVSNNKSSVATERKAMSMVGVSPTIAPSFNFFSYSKKSRAKLIHKDSIYVVKRRQMNYTQDARTRWNRSYNKGESGPEIFAKGHSKGIIWYSRARKSKKVNIDTGASVIPNMYSEIEFVDKNSNTLFKFIKKNEPYNKCLTPEVSTPQTKIDTKNSTNSQKHSESKKTIDIKNTISKINLKNPLKKDDPTVEVRRDPKPVKIVKKQSHPRRDVQTSQTPEGSVQETLAACRNKKHCKCKGKNKEQKVIEQEQSINATTNNNIDSINSRNENCSILSDSTYRQILRSDSFGITKQNDKYIIDCDDSYQGHLLAEPSLLQEKVFENDGKTLHIRIKNPIPALKRFVKIFPFQKSDNHTLIKLPQPLHAMQMQPKVYSNLSVKEGSFSQRFQNLLRKSNEKSVSAQSSLLSDCCQEACEDCEGVCCRPDELYKIFKSDEDEFGDSISKVDSTVMHFDKPYMNSGKDEGFTEGNYISKIQEIKQKAKMAETRAKLGLGDKNEITLKKTNFTCPIKSQSDMKSEENKDTRSVMIDGRKYDANKQPDLYPKYSSIIESLSKIQSNRSLKLLPSIEHYDDYNFPTLQNSDNLKSQCNQLSHIGSLSLNPDQLNVKSSQEHNIENRNEFSRRNKYEDLKSTRQPSPQYSEQHYNERITLSEPQLSQRNQQQTAQKLGKNTQNNEKKCGHQTINFDPTKTRPEPKRNQQPNETKKTQMNDSERNKPAHKCDSKEKSADKTLLTRKQQQISIHHKPDENSEHSLRGCDQNCASCCRCDETKQPARIQQTSKQTGTMENNPRNSSTEINEKSYTNLKRRFSHQSKHKQTQNTQFSEIESHKRPTVVTSGSMSEETMLHKLVKQTTASYTKEIQPKMTECSQQYSEQKCHKHSEQMNSNIVQDNEKVPGPQNKLWQSKFVQRGQQYSEQTLVSHVKKDESISSCSDCKCESSDTKLCMKKTDSQHTLQGSSDSSVSQFDSKVSQDNKPRALFSIEPKTANSFEQFKDCKCDISNRKCQEIKSLSNIQINDTELVPKKTGQRCEDCGCIVKSLINVMEKTKDDEVRNVFSPNHKVTIDKDTGNPKIEITFKLSYSPDKEEMGITTEKNTKQLESKIPKEFKEIVEDKNPVKYLTIKEEDEEPENRTTNRHRRGVRVVQPAELSTIVRYDKESISNVDQSNGLGIRLVLKLPKGMKVTKFNMKDADAHQINDISKEAIETDDVNGNESDSESTVKINITVRSNDQDDINYDVDKDMQREGNDNIDTFSESISKKFNIVSDGYKEICNDKLGMNNTFSVQTVTLKMSSSNHSVYDKSENKADVISDIVTVCTNILNDIVARSSSTTRSNLKVRKDTDVLRDNGVKTLTKANETNKKTADFILKDTNEKPIELEGFKFLKLFERKRSGYQKIVSKTSLERKKITREEINTRNQMSNKIDSVNKINVNSFFVLDKQSILHKSSSGSREAKEKNNYKKNIITHKKLENIENSITADVEKLNKTKIEEPNYIPIDELELFRNKKRKTRDIRCKRINSNEKITTAENNFLPGKRNSKMVCNTEDNKTDLEITSERSEAASKNDICKSFVKKIDMCKQFEEVISTSSCRKKTDLFKVVEDKKVPLEWISNQPSVNEKHDCKVAYTANSNINDPKEPQKRKKKNRNHLKMYMIKKGNLDQKDYETDSTLHTDDSNFLEKDLLQTRFAKKAVLGLFAENSVSDINSDVMSKLPKVNSNLEDMSTGYSSNGV